MINNKNVFPVLPLRDVVVFPGMVLPLFVGRKRSIKAIEVAMENQKNILLVAQKSPSNDDPKQSDMYNVGSIASILQMLNVKFKILNVQFKMLNLFFLRDTNLYTQLCTCFQKLFHFSSKQIYIVSHT